MKQKGMNWPVLLIVIAALLVGGFVGSMSFPVEKIVEKEVPVEKIVEVPVNVPVPVCSDLCCTDVCSETPEDLLEKAIDDFLVYMDDEDELSCGGDEFDLDEVNVAKVYDEYKIEYDGTDYTVYGTVKLNFKQDDEKRCRDTYDFSVFYEEDEEPEVTIL